MSAKNTILILALSLSLLIVSVSGVYAVTISSVGTMTNARGWLFSQSTPFGIYYGFGDAGGYPPASDIYYFDFLTGTNTLIKSQTSQPDIGLPDVKEPTIWGDPIYSAIVGDKIFIADVYYDYPQHAGPGFGLPELSDANGIYAIDTKTNTFYLYDRTSFRFFADNLASPMTSVGSYLYFFVESERRVYRYDTITKQSTALSALPSDIGFGGIVYPVSSKIYITTFKEYSSNNNGINNSLYVYDTLKDSFTYLATSPLIPSNNYRSNSVINGKLYFVGGEDPIKIDYTALDKIVEYDPSTNQFSVIDTLKDKDGINYALAGASTTSVGGSLYVVGGEVHSEPEITDSIIKIGIAPKDLATTIAEYLCKYYSNSVCSLNQNLLSVMAEPFYLFLTKDYKNRGDYISYVAQKTNEFVRNSLITGKEKGVIMSVATKLAAAIKK
ncbi:hypothetical protein HYT26_00875 [Candidatus Pacearchaeota archaeon]|nr:hypothetical protein [Candidatus Pacearchaeota archaeon]